ncbi:MAG: MIP/aquaporin family protein [Balneolaceae bacterium]
MRKYTAEFIGTFFLMFGIVMSVANAGDIAPLAIGSILMVMVYAGGPISGAHYNPAVTLAVWMRGKCSTAEVPGYLIAQITAASIAAFTANFILGVEPGTGLEVNFTPALLSEFLGTFALCFVILMVAFSKRSEGNSYFGLAIGFTVAAMAFSVGSVSGGAFNPAVAIGGSFAGLLIWSNIWIYLVANLVAGAVASLAFNYVDAE